MEVTKSTFNQLLPEIKESINNATFLTIDCEFSGLNMNNDINSFDTPKQYYEKIRRNCRDFLVIQYGICTFRYDREKNDFKQKAFNFYIFPKVVSKYVPDQRFLCQVSSIDFLIAQDFDFNKLFKHGIPYLNSKQKTRYRDLLTESHEIRRQNISSNVENQHKVNATKEADKEFIKNIREQIKQFINSDAAEELVLPKCNGFLRLLIYQLVRDEYNDKVDISNKCDNNDRILVVTRFKGIEVRKKELDKVMRDETVEMENTIGFSKIIQHIIESKKLIIGHNMMLDLVHTIDKFVMPLPEDYEEFKETVHALFPLILDTKLFSVTEPFNSLIASNVLGHLLETLSKPPFTLANIEVGKDAFGYHLNDKKEHEAGYDAYITGVCFLAMWKYIGENSQVDDVYDFDLLKPYLNRLFLMRLQDSPYVHLGEEDPNPSRDHVFHVTFPKEWKTSDITQLFSPFGGVHVAWISDTSAYVGLIKREEATVVYNTLSQSETYTITKFADRQTALNNISTSKSPYLNKIRKKTWESPTSKRIKLNTKDLPFNKSIESSEKELVEQHSNKMRDNRQEEEEEEESNLNSETVPIAKVSRKRTISKTFEEDNSWD